MRAVTAALSLWVLATCARVGARGNRRNWQSYSVRAFGAAGDGVTHDTAAVRAAAAAVTAAGGGVRPFRETPYSSTFELYLRVVP